MAAANASGVVIPTDFDLDISIVEQAPVIADLMNDTSDTCGTTCESACSNSTCE